ncbi:MAG TPA: YigZ family protein [Chitinophagaceae bacterium]|nr:YigZ family protein [Chitinophagaceae bacterium]
MNEPDFYYTIEKAVTAEFKDRGSKFIAYAFPIEKIADFKPRLDELKKEHPKAAHHCFAYRIGLDKNIFRVSDDGEPSGTAGKPILGQIDSKMLTNVAIVVVRYFGGTLLGVPGLINAYKTSSALALGAASIIQKSVEINYQLQFDYTNMNEVMTVIKKFNCTIVKQQLELFCYMEIKIVKSNLQLCLKKLLEIRGLELNKC